MRTPSYIIWPIIFTTQLLATSLLAWHLLAQISFAYPLGYKLLDLDKHIAEFAPINWHKRGFESTTPQDHWNLFAQITDAVQHHGNGLAEINYKLTNGTDIPLMHKAEIVHLQDVSNLIDTFYFAGVASGFIWLALFFIAYRLNLIFPPLRNIILGFCFSLLVATALILSLGATNVFYWLHTKIFPAGHQWFFYYEDSLMTTLMKAPDIFAFIAVLLVSLLAIIWGLSTYVMARLLKNNVKDKSITKLINQKKISRKK